MSRPACRFVGEDDGDEKKYENASCDFAESVSDLEPDEVKNLEAERLIRIKIPVSDGSIKLKCFDVLDLYGWIQSHPGGELFSRECVLTEGQKTRIRNQAETYLRNNNREDEIKQAEQRFDYPQIHFEEEDEDEEDDEEEEEPDFQAQYSSLKRTIILSFLDDVRYEANANTSLDTWPMEVVAPFLVQALYQPPRLMHLEMISKGFLKLCQVQRNIELQNAVKLAAQKHWTLEVLQTLCQNLYNEEEKKIVIRYIFLTLLGTEIWDQNLKCFYKYKSDLFNSHTTNSFYSDCLEQLIYNTSVNAEIILEFVEICKVRIAMQIYVLQLYQHELFSRINKIMYKIFRGQYFNTSTDYYGDLIQAFKIIREAGIQDHETTIALNNLVEQFASSSTELFIPTYQAQQVVDFIHELVIERGSNHNSTTSSNTSSSRKRQRTTK